jgi:dipeptidyl aminopeptidase/acylaminoacyl peptidase
MFRKKHLTLLAIVAVVAVFASSATVPAASRTPSADLEMGAGGPGARGALAEAVARQGEARALTPLDVARVRTVGEIAISPDGAQIAFTLSVPREPGSENNGPAWSELHLIGFDGSDHRPFVTGEVNVSHVRWSPDGAYVSYAARREGDDAAAVYVIPATGGESRRLVHYPTSVSNFEWRPDGRAVGFIARDPVDEELQKLRARGFNQEVYEEDNSARRIVVVDLPDGPSGEAEEPQVIDGVIGHPYGIAWSPDGDRFVIDPAPTPLVDDRYMFRRLQIVGAESGSIQGKIDNPGKLGQFAWTPDGSSVVLISGADINDPMEGRLMVVSTEGERLRDILPELAGHIARFEFTPDGDIVYLANIGVGAQLGRVAPDGTQAEVLFSSSDLVVDAFSVDASGSQIALVAESPTMPREVYALSLAAPHEPRRLTDSNPWLEEIGFAEQEIVRWDARDGREIEGLLIHPLERAEGERVPTIVVAHGGPESHYKNGWLTGYSSPGQMAAARGYAVFYPNYRGSTGRGVEFTKAHQGDGGGAEFDDVLAGVDYLIERGIADADKVGITGGSYGGYFTAWGATRHSDRFAAGVMFVGISNQLSKTGTSDIPNELGLVHWLTTPYENLDLFLERSPVLYVDRAHTPLLILHGKDDPRVNPGQSRELHRALKLKGDVPVRLILYPGEGHGNARAAARYDYSLRMLRWFDHFLKEGGTEPPPWRVDYGLKKK